MRATRPIRTADVACSGCGGQDDVVMYEGREHEYPDTTDRLFPVVRCRRCGLVRLNPRPAVEELGRIYPPSYYAYNLVSERAPRGRGLGERIKAARYQKRLAKVVDHLDGVRTVRVLDVGCADGRLLDWYKAGPLGDRLETHGIEMNESAAEIARTRGHHVVTGRFETDEELAAGSFDVILAFHVIEHVADPRRFAERAAELLSPGGIFVITTPNIDSVDARRFGPHWGGNHFPRHWTFYDAATLAHLGEQVGLRAEHIEYELNPVFWNWSVHSWLRARRPRSRWPDRLFPPVRIFLPSLQAFLLLSAFTLVDGVVRLTTGKTASMEMWLRKPS